MIKWGHIPRSTCLWTEFITQEGLPKTLHVHLCEIDAHYKNLGPHTPAQITFYMLQRIKLEPTSVNYMKVKPKKRSTLSTSARAKS